MRQAPTNSNSLRTMPARSLSLLRPVFLALLLLAACESATAPAPAPAREGQITGTWSGERFKGSATATLYRDTLYLWGTSPGDHQGDREVHVSVAYNGAGEYRLAAGQAGMQYVFGGDAISATYTVAADGSATLVIEQAQDGTIFGRVSFAAVAEYGEQPAGSGARFTGRFRSVPVTVQP